MKVTKACSNKASSSSSSVEPPMPAYGTYASPGLPPCGIHDSRDIISPYFQFWKALPLLRGLNFLTDLWWSFSLPQVKLLKALNLTPPTLKTNMLHTLRCNH